MPHPNVGLQALCCWWLNDLRAVAAWRPSPEIGFLPLIPNFLVLICCCHDIQFNFDEALDEFVTNDQVRLLLWL